MAHKFVVLSFDRLVGLLGHADLMPQAIFEFGVANIVFAMKNHGFALYDIIGITHRPLERSMVQAGAVFVQEMSLLRSGPRWSS